MPRGKLKYSLDQQKGRNLKLEKQRKHEKSATKKRSTTGSKDDVVSEPTEAEILAALNADTEDEDEEMEALNGELDEEAHELEVEDEDDEEEEEEEDEEDVDPEEDGSEGGIPLSDVESLDSEDRADVIPFQRLTINNIAALQKAHRSMLLPKVDDFSSRQVITSAEPLEIADVHDDLNRELAFYKQCLEAAVRGRALLKQESASFTRPNDYFAEMVKTDEHMGKIKAKIVQAESDKKAAAEARRLRDLKKFGKQVQVAKLQERDRTRKQTLDKINQLKRKRHDGDTGEDREADLFDVALEEAQPKRGENRSKAGSRTQVNDKRRKKDAKFGFGGKKRFAKSGDAVSSGDMTGFSAKRMKASTKGSKRLGKSRRAKATR